MIRINVLPERRARRARRLLRTLVISLALVVGAPLIVEATIWYVLNRQTATLELEQAALTKELETLKAKVKEVERIERDNAVFEGKRKVIEELKTQQGGPVRLLGEISKSLPPRVWIVSLGEKAGKLNMTGMAYTNADVVDFVLGLQRSPLLKEVVLVETHETREQETAVYTFTLTCMLSG